MKMLLMVFLCLGLSLSLVGCPSPPRDVVVLEVNGNDVAFADKNYDGAPDLDSEGNPIMLSNLTKSYKTANTVDTYGSTGLRTAGELLGIPILATIGALWSRQRWGKKVVNLIGSFQSARDELKKDDKLAGALNIVDNALKANQLPQTVKLVREIKTALEAKRIGV